MTNAELEAELAALHAFYDKQKLYRWFDYFVVHHKRLSAADITDAKQVLAKFDYLKDKP
jgi:hypothetical protein